MIDVEALLISMIVLVVAAIFILSYNEFYKEDQRSIDKNMARYRRIRKIGRTPYIVIVGVLYICLQILYKDILSLISTKSVLPVNKLFDISYLVVGIG